MSAWHDSQSSGRLTLACRAFPRATIGIVRSFYFKCDNIPDTLEFTLRSGLDELASLDKLRMIGFKDLFRKIDCPTRA